MTPRIAIGSSELLAVPAVHDRSVFAEQVNRLCRDDATRPDAIAVELSPDAVATIVAWFKELGVGQTDKPSLPCMLGLVKSNNRIHPRHRQRVIRLQELHGKPLPEIAPEILRRELGFAPVSLLCLSATDSIIEAIRSAVELNLPVYGVDLGDMADGDRGRPMLQDPVLAQGNLETYVRYNAPSCVPHRDEVIDDRRELVMAARLKRLTQEYRRVLFTCGIGHWQELCARLNDPTLVAATDFEAQGREHYFRVLVAPALAVHQMDLFPELTACFESLRRLSLDAPERRMDYAARCRAKLAAACECAEPKNREAVVEMSQLLSNLCLVSQSRVPDLFMTLQVAQMMVSPAFAGRLGDVLVNEALNWAKPEQWPNLPYLRGVRASAKSPRISAEGQQAQLENQGRRSPTFYVSFLSEANDRVSDWTIPPLREPKHDGLKQSGGANPWVWPPCETLLYGTAYAAAEIADRNKRERSPEPFSGSLHDGVDIKATLRAVIRGEKRIQVRAASAPIRSASLAEGGDEPTVFIFEREEAVSDGSWNTFTAGAGGDIRRFVRHPAAFDHATHIKGSSFVVNVSFSVWRRPPEHLQPHVSSLRYLYGSVVFGSPSLCPKQSARWLEECNYTRCPIMRYASMEGLIESYRREHQLALDRANWVSTLIRLALPYARQRVMIILADPQAVATSVFREAQSRGINLELFPITHFPPERIQTIRHQYLVYPRDVHTIDYPEELQAAFGESPTKHLDLLPPRVRAQLNSED